MSALDCSDGTPSWTLNSCLDCTAHIKHAQTHIPVWWRNNVCDFPFIITVKILYFKVFRSRLHYGRNFCTREQDCSPIVKGCCEWTFLITIAVTIDIYYISMVVYIDGCNSLSNVAHQTRPPSQINAHCFSFDFVYK